MRCLSKIPNDYFEGVLVMLHLMGQNIFNAALMHAGNLHPLIFFKCMKEEALFTFVACCLAPVLGRSRKVRF